MKYFQPKSMKPNITQFQTVISGKISNEGQNSLAYKSVYGLFEQAQYLYRDLDSTTNSTNLTRQQEYDAVALTALYVKNLRTQTIHDLVASDPAINGTERQVLHMTLEVYKATCEANHSVLGHPKWIND